MENNDKKGVIVILALTVMVMIFLYVTMDKDDTKFKHSRYGYSMDRIYDRL